MSNLLTGSWGKGKDFWNACDLMKCQFAEHRDEYYRYRKDPHNFHNESIARSSIIIIYFLIYFSKIAIYFFSTLYTGNKDAERANYTAMIHLIVLETYTFSLHIIQNSLRNRKQIQWISQCGFASHLWCYSNQLYLNLCGFVISKLNSLSSSNCFRWYVV